MCFNEPQKLTSILTQVPLLSKIQERTFALKELANVVNELLSSPLNMHCKVANYRQGILILEVSSASWLTRLKYEQGDLLVGIRRKILPSLSSIQYQINPDILSQLFQLDKQLSNKPTMTSIMTPKSAMLLYTLAENAPDKLKKQLIKLANHAK